MNYKLNYSICPLHDEPLNYICLHDKCRGDRVICVICRQERHSQSHHIIPLKIYLASKVEKLKCLTETEVKQMMSSLNETRNWSIRRLDKIKMEIDKKIEEVKSEFQCFYDEQLETIEKCQGIINQNQIWVENLNTIEKGLFVVNHYQQYSHPAGAKLREAENNVLKILTELNLETVLTEDKWVGHPDVSINHNILLSNDQSYKVVYMSKPLTIKSSKVNFKVLSTPRNWIAIGICHRNIVEKRGFDFKYFTIGHGVYAVSSNGGSWSHLRPESNNRLGAIEFNESQTICVGYDGNNNRALFESEGGKKFSLEIDVQERGSLHYCVIFYYKGDQIELMTSLD